MSHLRVSSKDFFCVPLALIDNVLKESEDATLTHVVSSSKKTVEKTLNDPVLKEKLIASEDAGNMHQPSPLKQITQVLTENA
ncbi:hypothetical protein E5676_scaffold478G00070 [Cucumis melo var. makuwa]|uniref:Uncharacterized protein n=1 Tax=Cucumis melo var. makuwa TaxID=1194695 RepID=A0A5D3DTU0_CUCMM|nr:hypothetical protein E5676_scaffold478G00070 [Cucumis melo var. makuwa]